MTEPVTPEQESRLDAAIARAFAKWWKDYPGSTTSGDEYRAREAFAAGFRLATTVGEQP